MSFIPLVIYCAELAVVAIILWCVCDALPMSPNIRRIAQALIVLICILSGLRAVLASSTPDYSSSRLTPGPSSIIK